MANIQGDGKPIHEDDPPIHSPLDKVKHWIAKNDKSDLKVEVPQTKGFSFRKLLSFMGPGFLISIAYIDPGNFATDIQAGAQFNYRFIWVLVFATFLGLLLQVLSARLGMVTGKHLATVCREEYGHRTKTTVLLWLVTESAIIAADIPEIIGTAFALKMLFGLKLWIGVLITGIDTMLFLGIQYFGVRYLEMFIGGLVAAISVCFVIELGFSPIEWTSAECPSDWCSHFPPGQCVADYCGIYLAGFLPRINSDGLYIAVSLLGAVIMPHNLYLHSALVLSRNVERKKSALKEANLYNWIECTVALTISAFINISILSVAAANFYPNIHNNYDTQYNDPNLDDTSRLLGNFLGKAAQLIFAISLLSSGQSSTLTGTYAGQFVMDGFLQIKMSLWKRNLITRSVAILPSLIISILSGESGSTVLIILSSAILSFQLPYALVPLLKFTSSKIKMGYFVNSRAIAVLLSILALLVIGANVYLVYDLFFDLQDGYVFMIKIMGLRVFVIILIVIVAIIYFTTLAYLIWKPVQVEEDSFEDDGTDEEKPLLEKKE